LAANVGSIEVLKGADLMRPQAVLDPLTLSPLTVAIAGRWS
jgi:hypothetical protein